MRKLILIALFAIVGNVLCLAQNESPQCAVIGTKATVYEKAAKTQPVMNQFDEPVVVDPGMVFCVSGKSGNFTKVKYVDNCEGYVENAKLVDAAKICPTSTGSYRVKNSDNIVITLSNTEGVLKATLSQSMGFLQDSYDAVTAGDIILLLNDQGNVDFSIVTIKGKDGKQTTYVYCYHNMVTCFV